MINSSNIDLAKNAYPITMYPLELLFHRGRIHIAGATNEMQCLIFVIDKAFNFSLTNETFNRKKYIGKYKERIGSLYGISEPINHKVYNIKLEFTEAYAESMKNFHWHHSEKWEKLKNGNFTAMNKFISAFTVNAGLNVISSYKGQ